MLVAELWRYPVKSMGGERLPGAEVGELGLAGDRSWGVVDNETGRVLTGRREPRLLLASAALHGGDLVITLPDGTRTDRTDDLAAWLDRDVTLRRAGTDGGVYENPRDFEREEDWVAWQGPPGAWHDSGRARVSLLSTATIGDWDVRRFRPNVLLDGSGEDDLVGHRVTIGTVALNVITPIGRCVMVTREQPGIARDLSVLRTINRERDKVLAVGALVSEAGRLAVGDRVHDLGRSPTRPSADHRA